MSNMNRMGNVNNRYQGHWKRVLAVCSAGLLRSPTIAFVLSNPPWNCNTRACGVSSEYALIEINDVLVEWADEIVCADMDHKSRVMELLQENNTPQKPVHVLGLEDSFKMRDTRLIQMIRERLDAIKFVGSVFDPIKDSSVIR